MKRPILFVSVAAAALAVSGFVAAEPRTRGATPERIDRAAPAEAPRRGLGSSDRTRADGQGATPLSFAPPPLPITTPTLRMHGLGVAQMTIPTGPLLMQGLDHDGPE